VDIAVTVGSAVRVGISVGMGILVSVGLGVSWLFAGNVVGVKAGKVIFAVDISVFVGLTDVGSEDVAQPLISYITINPINTTVNLRKFDFILCRLGLSSDYLFAQLHHQD
jgi:hypothetical protein